MAAVASMASVGESPSQPEALPLQGAAAGLGMSHQPAASYTDVGGGGEMVAAPDHRVSGPGIPRVVSSNLTPRPYLTPSYTVSQMGADWRDGHSALMWFDSTPRSTAGEYMTGSGARRGLLDLSPLYGALKRGPGIVPRASSNLAPTPTPDLEPWQLFEEFEQFDYDLAYHPGETIEPTPSPVQAATVRAAAQGGSLTEAEVIAVLREAGAPEEWIPPLLTIAFCESRWSPYAVGDGGNSLGMFQLWYGWARPMGYAPDDLYDPVKAARTALYVREVRGRFGGGGGWTCADLSGIY